MKKIETINKVDLIAIRRDYDARLFQDETQEIKGFLNVQLCTVQTLFSSCENILIEIIV